MSDLLGDLLAMTRDSRLAPRPKITLALWRFPDPDAPPMKIVAAGEEVFFLHPRQLAEMRRQLAPNGPTLIGQWAPGSEILGCDVVDLHGGGPEAQRILLLLAEKLQSDRPNPLELF